MSTLETAVARVAEARRLVGRLSEVRPEFMQGDDYFRNHMRLYSLRGRAARRLHRRLKAVPVIGLEILNIEERHERTVKDYESSFRDLWKHPEFNQGLFSWVENMFD